MLAQLGRWISNSHVAIAIVSIGTLTAFLISLLNGAISILSYFEDQKRIPRIELQGMHIAKKMAPTNMTQLIAGPTPNYKIDGPLAQEVQRSSLFPYVLVTVRFLNPSKSPVTFIKCELEIDILNPFEWKVLKRLKSDGYQDAKEHISGNRDTSNPHFFLMPGEVQDKDIMFFFIPFPEIIEFWKDEKVTFDANTLTVKCTDEFDQKIQAQFR